MLFETTPKTGDCIVIGSDTTIYVERHGRLRIGSIHPIVKYPAHDFVAVELRRQLTDRHKAG